MCPNRSKLVIPFSNTTNNLIIIKNSYYAIQQQPKLLNMSNSLELLQGSIADVQKKYEILSDIVSEANGKVHGSESHIVNTANSAISLIVYYEFPLGKRETVKRKFENLVRSQMTLQRNY